MYNVQIILSGICRLTLSEITLEVISASSQALCSVGDAPIQSQSGMALFSHFQSVMVLFIHQTWDDLAAGVNLPLVGTWNSAAPHS